MFCPGLQQDSVLIFSIDATYIECLGKCVNDSPEKHANSTMKKGDIDGQLRIYLIAKNNIVNNEELRYDYGDKDLPWRNKVFTSALYDFWFN